MNSVPRPKPWEQANSSDTNQADQMANFNTNNTTVQDTLGNNINDSETSITPPQLPTYPSGNSYNSPYYRGVNYGMNPQSGIGFGMGSNYNLGNGYGVGMNSNYGMGLGYGSNYGGLANYGYGNNYFGNEENMKGIDNGGITESTRATFQLLENLVGTINGFAQMLESSYMATYNSFFTLISFAEEVNKLKDILGGMFGVFNIIKILKKILRLRSPSQKALEGSKSQLVNEFDNFKKGKPIEKKKKLAIKPLLVFLLAVFGFPYILNKLIKRVHAMNNLKKGISNQDHSDGMIDPSKLEFARALYDFVPENPKIEVTLKKGDLMAITSRKDPLGNDSQWWKVRTKSGSVGYVPYNYIEIIKRQKKIENINENNDIHSKLDVNQSPI